MENPQREELTHILRPTLPWRLASTKTECGRGLDDVKAAVPVDEAAAIWKRHGATRAAFLLCSTCTSTVRRHAGWAGRPGQDESPALVLQREITYSDNRVLDGELRAIGALVAAHRTEFDDYLAGLAETTDLGERRAARGYRRSIAP